MESESSKPPHFSGPLSLTVRPGLPNPRPVLTQSADGAVVGLVAQCVCAGVAQTEVPAWQNEGIAQVGEAHHALIAVVAVLIV